MIKAGHWKVESKIDPRWNNEGTCLGDCFHVSDMEAWIEHCKKEFGYPPDDATKEFWKY